MLLKKKFFEVSLHFICIICMIFSITPVFGNGILSPLQRQRVEQCCIILAEVDKQGLESRLRHLEEHPHLEENIVILEALARTYQEIVQEQGVDNQKTKEWLYSKVLLNIGYLQLGGLHINKRDTVLNKLIRHKFKKYISAEILNNEDIFYSLDYLNN